MYDKVKEKAMDKSEPKSFWSNIILLFRFIAGIDRKIFIWLGISVCISALIPFPYILLSRKVIDSFANGADYSVTVKIIVIMAVSGWLIKTMNQFINTELDKKYCNGIYFNKYGYANFNRKD